MLTKNISRVEIECSCGCGFDVADYELLTVAQESADFFLHRDRADKVVMIITSGNRCKLHNKKIGGASNSQHTHGKAMDYKLKTIKNDETRFVSAYELAEFLDGKYPEKYGIGKYPMGRVHLDVRQQKARWSNVG